MYGDQIGTDKKSVITMRGITAKNGRHIDISTKLAMASLLSQNKILANKFEPLEAR